MTNTKSKPERVEDQQIRLTPKYEESYWTMKLGATRAELEDAIKAVGPKMDDVVKLLDSRPATARQQSKLTALGWLARPSLRPVRA